MSANRLLPSNICCSCKGRVGLSEILTLHFQFMCQLPLPPQNKLIYPRTCLDEIREKIVPRPALVLKTSCPSVEVWSYASIDHSTVRKTLLHYPIELKFSCLTKFMALMVLPPPIALAAIITGIRLFKAVSGCVARPGHTYGYGFQSPGTRTPASPPSKGPASMTRTLTATGKYFSASDHESYI